ncbi:11831_t:CDS:2, partial [Racocetra persica]
MNILKSINDPIHGYMQFEKWAIKFIDTPHFQRLRDIKQLGTAFYVFPGATHSRFEHSLGTAHLAYTLTKKLQEQLRNEKRQQRNEAKKRLRLSGSDNDRYENYDDGSENDENDLRNLKCVTLAALCHDLGHGPYSYLFYRDLIGNRLKDENWDPKDGSIMMFEDIIKNLIKLESIELKKEDGEFIKALIKGETTLLDKSNKRPEYLFDIVNNKRNSIDVDKFDYLARDCYYSG